MNQSIVFNKSGLDLQIVVKKSSELNQIQQQSSIQQPQQKNRVELESMITSTDQSGQVSPFVENVQILKSKIDQPAEHLVASRTPAIQAIKSELSAIFKEVNEPVASVYLKEKKMTVRVEMPIKLVSVGKAFRNGIQPVHHDLKAQNSGIIKSFEHKPFRNKDPAINLKKIEQKEELLNSDFPVSLNQSLQKFKLDNKQQTDIFNFINDSDEVILSPIEEFEPQLIQQTYEDDDQSIQAFEKTQRIPLQRKDKESYLIIEQNNFKANTNKSENKTFYQGSVNKAIYPNNNSGLFLLKTMELNKAKRAVGYEQLERPRERTYQSQSPEFMLIDIQHSRSNTASPDDQTNIHSVTSRIKPEIANKSYNYKKKFPEICTSTIQNSPQMLTGNQSPSNHIAMKMPGQISKLNVKVSKPLKKKQNHTQIQSPKQNSLETSFDQLSSKEFPFEQNLGSIKTKNSHSYIKNQNAFIPKTHTLINNSNLNQTTQLHSKLNSSLKYPKIKTSLEIDIFKNEAEFIKEKKKDWQLKQDLKRERLDNEKLEKHDKQNMKSIENTFVSKLDNINKLFLNYSGAFDLSNQYAAQLYCSSSLIKNNQLSHSFKRDFRDHMEKVSKTTTREENSLLGNLKEFKVIQEIPSSNNQPNKWIKKRKSKSNFAKIGMVEVKGILSQREQSQRISLEDLMALKLENSKIQSYLSGYKSIEKQIMTQDFVNTRDQTTLQIGGLQIEKDMKQSKIDFRLFNKVSELSCQQQDRSSFEDSKMTLIRECKLSENEIKLTERDSCSTFNVEKKANQQKLQLNVSQLSFLKTYVSNPEVYASVQGCSQKKKQNASISKDFLEMQQSKRFKEIKLQNLASSLDQTFKSEQRTEPITNTGMIQTANSWQLERFAQTVGAGQEWMNTNLDKLKNIQKNKGRKLFKSNEFNQKLATSRKVKDEVEIRKEFQMQTINHCFINKNQTQISTHDSYWDQNWHKDPKIQSLLKRNRVYQYDLTNQKYKQSSTDSSNSEERKFEGKRYKDPDDALIEQQSMKIEDLRRKFEFQSRTQTIKHIIQTEKQKEIPLILQDTESLRTKQESRPKSKNGNLTNATASLIETISSRIVENPMNIQNQFINFEENQGQSQSSGQKFLVEIPKILREQYDQTNLLLSRKRTTESAGISQQNKTDDMPEKRRTETAFGNQTKLESRIRMHLIDNTASSMLESSLAHANDSREMIQLSEEKIKAQNNHKSISISSTGIQIRVSQLGLRELISQSDKNRQNIESPQKLQKIGVYQIHQGDTSKNKDASNQKRFQENEVLEGSYFSRLSPVLYQTYRQVSELGIKLKNEENSSTISQTRQIKIPELNIQGLGIIQKSYSPKIKQKKLQNKLSSRKKLPMIAKIGQKFGQTNSGFLEQKTPPNEILQPIDPSLLCTNLNIDGLRMEKPQTYKRNKTQLASYQYQPTQKQSGANLHKPLQLSYQQDQQQILQRSHALQVRHTLQESHKKQGSHVLQVSHAVKESHQLQRNHKLQGNQALTENKKMKISPKVNKIHKKSNYEQKFDFELDDIKKSTLQPFLHYGNAVITTKDHGSDKKYITGVRFTSKHVEKQINSEFLLNCRLESPEKGSSQIQKDLQNYFVIGKIQTNQIKQYQNPEQKVSNQKKVNEEAHPPPHIERKEKQRGQKSQTSLIKLMASQDTQTIEIERMIDSHGNANSYGDISQQSLE